MRNVRKQIINDLMRALHECNLSDAFNDDGENDLPINASRQDNAYGDITNALNKLGDYAKLELTKYVETGDAPNYRPQQTTVLPNGADILAVDYVAGIVMASKDKTHIGIEYITWAFTDGDLRSTHTGHYMRNIGEAYADYNLRVKRGY